MPKLSVCGFVGYLFCAGISATWAGESLTGKVLSAGQSEFVLQTDDGAKVTVAVTRNTFLSVEAKVALSDLPVGSAIGVFGNPTANSNVITVDVMTWYCAPAPKRRHGSIVDFAEGQAVADIRGILLSKEPLKIQAAQGEQIGVFAEGRNRGVMPLAGKIFEIEFKKEDVVVYFGSNIQAAGNEPRARVRLADGAGRVAESVHLDRTEPVDLEKLKEPKKKRRK